MFQIELVKWEGEAPSRRPTVRESLIRAIEALKPWHGLRASWQYIRAPITPDPIGHPQCTEVLRGGDGEPLRVVYRRPD